MVFEIFSIAFKNEHCNEKIHFRKIRSQGSAGQAINSLISDAMIPFTASYNGREKTRK